MMPLPSHKNRAGYTKVINKEGNENTNAEVKISTRTIIAKILQFLKPDLKLATVGIVFLVVSCVGESMVPFYTGQVLDSILQHSPREDFLHFVSLLFVFSAVSSFCEGLQGYCLLLANRKLNMRIKRALFTSVMQQELGFFDKTQTGEILSRLTTDMTTMLTDMQFNTMTFLRNGLRIASVFVFMFQLSRRLSLVTFAGLPFIVILSHLYGKYVKITKAVHTSLADANRIGAEAISAIQTVRSFANEVGEIQRYAKQLKRSYKLHRKHALAFATYTGINQLIVLTLKFAVLCYGWYIFEDGTVTGGILLAFVLYQIKLGMYINSMGTVCSGLFESVGSADKVFQYINRKPLIERTGYLKSNSLTGCIEFDNVYFSYPSRPYEQVLKGISFKVNPGETVALVGPNGGGKTSCFNLIECFYMPNSGRVLLDGDPVYLYEHKYLHKQVSLVRQEPVLFARSVEQNIRYGLKDDEWTSEKIEEASKLANVHDIIVQLHDGYNTQAGEKGLQLSGGQKQRVAIARSLVRDPKVLLLDEATSALDTESEKLIQDAVYGGFATRTVLIIAHRLSTVEKADKILVIENGRVVEEGTHLELMLHVDGVYANLVNQQLLSK